MSDNNRNLEETGSEQEKQKKTEKIAAEILQMSKNKLLVNLRFMDMALNQFRIFPKPEATPFTASDGNVYLYDPGHILKAYMLDENLPIRNFLHTVLHCVFKHFFVGTLVDQKMWDLACDIAVEGDIQRGAFLQRSRRHTRYACRSSDSAFVYYVPVWHYPQAVYEQNKSGRTAGIQRFYLSGLIFDNYTCDTKPDDLSDWLHDR